MKTVVIGSAGQLGRDLLTVLTGNVVAVARQDVDINDRMALAQLLTAHAPDVVVNCAAYNFVDRAENDPEPAFAANAWAVRNLAKICRQLPAKLVHISSDYVFGLDRDNRTPLTEEARTGPLSVYGTSKLAGEYMARTFAPKHLIVRTCGLYGVHGVGGKGGNFVETMIKLGRAGKVLKVVDDQRCTPSASADVAKTIAALIEADAEGIVNVTNSGDTTWHGLAAEIFKLAKIDAVLSPTTSAEYAAPAHRPAYSVLSTAKLQSLGLPEPRHWKDALAEYLTTRKDT